MDGGGTWQSSASGLPADDPGCIATGAGPGGDRCGHHASKRQLASTLAALALLVPMFFLGKELFDRQIGFWAALLFQYLPVSGHHLSDGISEALFLFLVAMALWRGLLAVKLYRPLEFAWCGFWGGLAYLTRPEGALIVMAVSLTVVAMQLRARWRQPWTSFLKCGLSLGTSAAAVASIFFLTVGHFTTKVSVWDITGNLVTENVPALEAPGQPLFASIFGAFIQPSTDLPVRFGRACAAMATEFSQGFHYVGWVPALLALVWGWRGYWSDPRYWLIFGYCLLHAVILLLLAMVEYYVSDRHMLVLIMCGTIFTVVGVRAGAGLLSRWREKRRPAIPTWWTPQRITGALLLAGIVICARRRCSAFMAIEPAIISPVCGCRPASAKGTSSSTTMPTPTTMPGWFSWKAKNPFSSAAVGPPVIPW